MQCTCTYSPYSIQYVHILQYVLMHRVCVCVCVRGCVRAYVCAYSVCKYTVHHQLQHLLVCTLLTRESGQRIKNVVRAFVENPYIYTHNNYVCIFTYIRMHISMYNTCVMLRGLLQRKNGTHLRTHFI